MTVHLISVGKSVLTFLAEPHADAYPIDEDLLPKIEGAGLAGFPVTQAHDAEAVHAWLERCLVRRERQPRDELAAACAAAEPERWPRWVSAELNGLAAGHAAGDGIVLITSDTPDGLRSALWNAVALARRDLDRIEYAGELHHPGLPPGPVDGQVLIVRVPGMHAGNEKGFREAMRGLGVLGRHLAYSAGLAPDAAFRFHLSGGYKAAIPYLIGLAEGLRSLPGGRRVEAYVLHEDTEGAPIRLPLRCPTPESVRRELSRGWDSRGYRPDPPKPEALAGYAYEPDGEGWRLTAFGEGLRTLFGYGEEGLSAG